MSHTEERHNPERALTFAKNTSPEQAIKHEKMILDEIKHLANKDAILESYGQNPANISACLANMLIARGFSKDEYYCRYCRKIKKHSEFTYHNKLKTKKCNECISSEKKYDKETNAKKKDGEVDMSKCREAKKRQRLNRKKRAFAFVMDIKRNSKCGCGENRPEVLEFHHRENKQFDIPAAIHRGIGLKSLEAEIAKCDVICSNCHKYQHRKAV